MNKPVKVSHSRRLFESVVSDGTSTKTTHRVTESSSHDGLILRTQQLYSKILDQDYSANQLEDILEYHDFYRIHELDLRDKDEMEDAIWLHANHVQSHQLEELYNELNEYYNDLSKGLGNRWSTKRSNESRSKRRKSHKVNESSSRMHVEDMNNFIRVYPWYDVQTNDFIEIDSQGIVLVEGQVDIPTVEHALRVARKRGYKFSIVYRVVFMTHLLFSTNSEYDTTWGDDISPTAVSDRFSEFVFTREVVPAIMKSLQGPDSQLLRSLDDYKPNIDGLGAFIDSEVVVDDSGESARLEVVASMSKVDADTLNKVKRYITGQYSDGFGEGYEQRPVYQIYEDVPLYDWEDGDDTTYPGNINIHCHLWSRDGFEVFHKIEDTPDLLSESE